VKGYKMTLLDGIILMRQRLLKDMEQDDLKDLY
jgi:hypothetical protein